MPEVSQPPGPEETVVGSYFAPNYPPFSVWTGPAVDEAEAALDAPPRDVGDAFNQGVDRMRRLVCEYYDGFSFGKFVRSYPELRGTVTDLLIGDLFTDRVDKVWAPMESLYEAGKPSIPTWPAGTTMDASPARANELVVPEGRWP